MTARPNMKKPFYNLKIVRKLRERQVDTEIKLDSEIAQLKMKSGVIHAKKIIRDLIRLQVEIGETLEQLQSKS